MTWWRRRRNRSIDQLRADWDRLARHDAFFATLSDPARANGRWDADDFYSHGRAAIARLHDVLAERDVSLTYGRAADFGCGPGRLTFALAERFATVTGVDISRQMLERARARGVPLNCELVQQDDPRLPALERGSYDLVVSLYVLQHMRPREARAYLRTLTELLAPGGVLFVQIAHGYARDPGSQPRNTGRRVARRLAPGSAIALRRWAGLRRQERHQRRSDAPTFELHRVRFGAAQRILSNAGLVTTVLARDDPTSAAPLLSAWFLSQRPTAPDR